MKLNHIIAIAIVIAILFFGFISQFVMLQVAGQKAEAHVGNFAPAATLFSDGTYRGEYKPFGFLTGARVEFEISDNSLSRFEIQKLHTTPGYGVKPRISARIDSTGALNFDAITGATISSYFTKAAIKNTLIRNQDDTAK
ncbi:MAG: FMN-binding protein [Chitinivibrionales bacterium]|nr:FMN-binding protein [Chitinivibrionales bacterium]